jgi:dTDP-4-dehydrorhamnose 3,5-epimerase
LSRFVFHPTPLSGLLLVERKPIADSRGFFARFFCAEEFALHGFAKPVAQMNQTLTRKQGAVRGMHFQKPPHAEVKLVTCLTGRIFDVAVDVRQGSASFLHWHGEELSGENMRSLLIPEGFAHGFQTLSEDCELLYLHSRPHEPGAEGGLNPQDVGLAIDWPVPISEMSDRDRGYPFVSASISQVRP